MENIRQKWDTAYRPWFTKLITAVIVFLGAYGFAQVGPLSQTAALAASAVAALLCLWNPGGAALVYIVMFCISAIHINSAMVGLIAILILIYCASGYASTAVMAITPMFFIAAWAPDGMYWGMLAIAMYFTYRSRETWTSFIFPAFMTMLIVMFGRYGTSAFLYPEGFALTKSPASDVDSFIAMIDFTTDSNLLAANIAEIVKLMALLIAAGCIIWLLFRNKWMRGKLRNTDICEAVMFVAAAVVLILLDLAVRFGLGYETGASYGIMLLSVAAGYLITRPFASDKVAETFVTKAALRHRKDAAVDFIAVYPKAEWDTPHVNEAIKTELKSLDPKDPARVLIEREANASAEAVAELVARRYDAKIIRIDYDIFQKLHEDHKEEAFRKIFVDAKAQAPTVVCFNDAEKFFYQVDDNSGEYIKRDHRIYMETIGTLDAYENVSLVCITDDAGKLDQELFGEGRIDKRIVYTSAENQVKFQEKETDADRTEKIKAQRKKGYKTTALALAALVAGGAALWYYFGIYENQKYDIHETAPVETQAVGQVDMSPLWEEGGQAKIADAVADIMASNEATFFYLEPSGDGSAMMTVYQTDEATFNEKSQVEKGMVLKRITKAADVFFNTTKNNMPASPLQNINNSNVFAGSLSVGECAVQIDGYFGGFAAFFVEHELELSCEGMTATKLAYAPGINNDDMYMEPTWYCVLEGDVMTESAVGDISSVPFLAPVGETSHIVLTVAADYYEEDKTYGCNAFGIERTE